jgi:hypothetical protein
MQLCLYKYAERLCNLKRVYIREMAKGDDLLGRQPRTRSGVDPSCFDWSPPPVETQLKEKGIELDVRLRVGWSEPRVRQLRRAEIRR